MEGYQMFTILSPKKTKTAISKQTSVAPNRGENEPVEIKRPATVKKAAAKPKAESKKDDDEIF